MDQSVYIIPHDFTNVGDNALKYGLFLAKSRNVKIYLLHVVDKESSRTQVLEKLQTIIDNLDLKVGDCEVVPAVEVGSIFDTIPKFAEQEKAQLIIMGTHGAQGMQKLFGSYAMKVVTNSKVPFLVVQDGVLNFQIKNIVIPITYSKESLQVLNIGMKIASMFDAKIHIAVENYSDSGLIQKTKIRINLITKQFEEYGVEHVIETIKHKNFQKGVISYAKTNNCDIIAVAHYSNSLIPQLDRFTQGLITNDENIPCLVMNSQLLSSLYF